MDKYLSNFKKPYLSLTLHNFWCNVFFNDPIPIKRTERLIDGRTDPHRSWEVWLKFLSENLCWKWTSCGQRKWSLSKQTLAIYCNWNIYGIYLSWVNIQFEFHFSSHLPAAAGCLQGFQKYVKVALLKKKTLSFGSSNFYSKY